eukprot:Em0018g957a
MKVSTKYLRPLARSFSNAAIFPPTTDPALIEFENTITSNNCMKSCRETAQYLGVASERFHVVKGAGALAHA